MSASPSSALAPQPAARDRLADFVGGARRLFVLTGAGCSTASGIPDYRDAGGHWKCRQPVNYREFLRSERVRRRYWARSLAGWPHFAAARPNAAHRALARLEQAGRLHFLVTQNVDRLHQQAGARRVMDLHGRLDRVRCLGCGRESDRAEVQERLHVVNPDFATPAARPAPDGDAQLGFEHLERFRVPDCARCGGVLKPAVVFFGEGVPGATVRRALDRLAEADAVLVVGSSLMVFSGYRFCREAARRGLPLAAVNRGRTRADSLLALKIEEDCGDALSEMLPALGLPPEKSDA